MLYHIVIILILSVLAYSGIVLFRKIANIRKRNQEWRLKESEFMNKLVPGGVFKTGQLSGFNDLVEERFLNRDVFKLQTTDSDLDRDEIRALILKEIDRLSDEEIKQFYHELQERPQGKPRKHNRINLFLLVDYSVDGKYYRDSIQDISEGGVFIKTSQTFSEGKKIKMTFMSPNYQKPFKIKGEVVRVHADGVGVRFTMESQVQEAALKSFMNNIQDDTVKI
jgi:Tfp pilus assembly protein PilZ